MTARDVALPVAERADAEPVTRRAPFSDNPRVRHAGSGPGSAFWMLRCSCSVRKASTSAASLASANWPAARESPSTSTSRGRKRSSAAWRARSPARSSASTEAIDPLTPDAAGWDGLRAWVGRYGDIHARYGPIFQAFPSTFEDDVELTAAAVRVRDQSVARIRSKLSTSDLPPRQLDPLDRTVACLSRQDPRRRRHPSSGRAGGVSAGTGRGRLHQRDVPLALRQ